MFHLFLLVLLASGDHRIIKHPQDFKTQSECRQWAIENASDIMAKTKELEMKIEAAACQTDEQMKKQSGPGGQDVNAL
jgi:protein subunit release factor B